MPAILVSGGDSDLKLTADRSGPECPGGNIREPARLTTDLIISFITVGTQGYMLLQPEEARIEA